MANDNTATIAGNITRDPELKYTPGGTPVATFGVAVNHRFQKNGEWEESVSFFDVVCWQQLGENARSIPKGTRVVVTGRFEQRSWENQNGEKRSKVELVADDVAVSLKWKELAQGGLVRNEQNGDRSSSNGGGRSPSRGSSNGGRGRDAEPDYALDEEPF